MAFFPVNRTAAMRALPAGVLLAVAGCGELPPAPVTPATVRLIFQSGCETVPVCRDCMLAITALDRNGQETLPPALTWSSSDENKAVVDGGGNVTGVASGTVEIEVSNPDGSVTAEKRVTILPSNSQCTPQ